ncbi:hypothetical protein R5R35_003970 [Gryllus longicercus]|uniref:Ionotropic receptor n=1 Tax=Gryllus longicercus TaxID=2509291 RepID=A0AAN9VP68_9ORTH
MVWCTALGLVLLNAFSGIFTSYFSVPRRGTELNTLDEVDRAVDKVVAMPRVVADFKDVDISSVRLLAKLSEFKFDTEEILSGRAAVMDTESTLEAVRRMKEVLQDGASPLRTVPECVVSPAYLSFPVRKGWPLVHRYSALVQRLVEGGVVQRLTREGLRNFSVSLELPEFVDVALADNPKPLVLIHFLEAYILLASGLMAATAAFLGEAMQATLMKRRKKLQQQDERLKETQPSQADPDEGNDLKKSEKYLVDSVVHNEDNDGKEEDCIVHVDLEEDDGKTDPKERDAEERNKGYTLETEQDIANVEKENKDCSESGFNEITTTVVLYVDKERDVEELKVLDTEQVTPNNGRELIGCPESEFNEVTTNMVLDLLADNKIECHTTERIERGYEK